MVKIDKFSAELICGEDTLLLGNNERKNASIGKIINTWPKTFPDRALVVLDHKGRFYESFQGEALLADLSSEGSLIPDVVEPFVANEDIGAGSENIAYAMRQAVYQEIKSRDANDKFFDDLGKLSTDRMLVYMLETAKNVLCNIAVCAGDGGEAGVMQALSEKNLFPIFCRQHRFIETLMTKTIGGESDALPVKYRLKEAEAKNGFITREFALARYILEHELRFQKNGDRDAPVPFADLLFTNGDNTNTQRCIKMQADASTADFRALITLMTRGAGLFRSLDTLKLEEYLRAPQGRPLFVCSSGSASADRGFAPLLIAALGAAAQNAGSSALILIPELDRWGLLNYLDKFRQSWDRLCFAFGYDNFSRLSLESRTGDEQLLETLYSSSTQRIWHASEEERLNRAFGAYVAAADVIYRPEDLNEDIRAVEKEGRVSYASLEEEPQPAPLRRRVRLRPSRGAAKLWITEGAKRQEKLTLESLLEEGESL
ncbi:MAG: hypothetical protein Q4C86_04295 [bacterium]|nr:hypothetical protein [bacterium]